MIKNISKGNQSLWFLFLLLSIGFYVPAFFVVPFSKEVFVEYGCDLLGITLLGYSMTDFFFDYWYIAAVVYLIMFSVLLFIKIDRVIFYIMSTFLILCSLSFFIITNLGIIIDFIRLLGMYNLIVA